MGKDQESAGRGGNRLAVLKDRVSVHWRVLRLAETKRAVLITGVTGIVGRALAKHLRDVYDLRGLARRPAETHGVRMHQADITDPESLKGPMEGVDTVVHLAGMANRGSGWDEACRLNLEGAYNVFEAARQAGVRRVVFASTNHVTGLYTRQRQPMNARMPVAPDSFYGVSKAACEAMGRFYAAEFGLSVISLRIGWVNDEDDPSQAVGWERGEELMRMWLSHRDLAQIVRKCIEVPGVDHAIFYAMSANTGSLWDQSDAAAVLGYAPQDNSADHCPEDFWLA